MLAILGSIVTLVATTLIGAIALVAGSLVGL